MTVQSARTGTTTQRPTTPNLAALVVTGVVSAMLSGYGLLMFGFGHEPRAQGLLPLLFCMAPTLSFPVFLISLASLRVATAASWILAVVNFATLFGINWEECRGGHCTDASLIKTALGAFIGGPMVITSILIAVALQGVLIGRRSSNGTTGV
jgi:hypothetical protein